MLRKHLTIKAFQFFFINLQIASNNVKSLEDYYSSRVVLNVDCRDTELPANGDCDDGWYVIIGNTHTKAYSYILDKTASIECKK